MLRFVARRLSFMLVTMFIVSVVVFMITEAAPGDVARHILGRFAQPEQVAALRRQLGLDRPLYVRYADWLIGSDWRASKLIGRPLRRTKDPETGTIKWWAVDSDGLSVRWKMVRGELVEWRLMPDGTTEKSPADDVWQTNRRGESVFWGVDTDNRAVLWKRRTAEEEGSAIKYLPLQRGLLRGDPGVSFRTNRPVSRTLFGRVRNSAILAAVSFVVVMPLALLLGLVAGANEAEPVDRILSITSLAAAASPSFATGIFLILIFGVGLELVPAVTVVDSDRAIFENPAMLTLPVLTLTLIELGYVLRITRASMLDVMGTAYIRTAVLKGLPRWQVILKHAARNALIAPITVIMLHVNWLIGRIVVVEALFGFPGLGTYLLQSAMVKDVYGIEAGAMLMVALAVGTQLIADVLYALLNPRIRYT